MMDHKNMVIVEPFGLIPAELKEFAKICKNLGEKEDYYPTHTTVVDTIEWSFVPNYNFPRRDKYV